MSEDDASKIEIVSRLADLPTKEFLRAIRFDLGAALTSAKGNSLLLMNIKDIDLTTERRKECAGHILHALEHIDEILDITVKALALRESNKSPNSES